MQKKALIGGSNGLLGSEMVKFLCDLGWTVYGIDKDIRGHLFGQEGSTTLIGQSLSQKYSNYLQYFIDIRDNDKISDFYKEHGPFDFIGNFQAQPSHEYSTNHALEDFSLNANATMVMLENYRQYSPEAIFIHASSSKVYGDSVNNLPLVEYETRLDLPSDHKYYNGVDEEFGRLDGELHSLFGACFHKDTEVLTLDGGWKLFSELKGNELVATVNKSTQKLEFQPIKQIHKYAYNGKMLYQKNRRLEFCVTPNHKLFVDWHRTGLKLKNPKLIEAETCFGKTYSHLLGADYNGDFVDMEYFEIGDRKIPIIPFLKFMGLYLSEGSYYLTKNGNYNINLATKDKHEQYAEIIKEMGYIPNSQKDCVRFSNKVLFNYLVQFGKATEKHIPNELKRLPLDKIQILFDFLRLGDGDKRIRKNDSSRYTSVSKQLADDFQLLCILLGYTAHITSKEKPIKENHNQVYRIWFSKSRTTTCNLVKNNSEWVDYNDDVYCVSVENETVLTRYKGFIFFSGNSKACADIMAKEYATYFNLPISIFRPVCISGSAHRGSTSHGYLAYVVKCVAEQIPYFVNGLQGKILRDNIHAYDLCTAFYEVYKNPCKAGTAFNMGAGRKSCNSVREALTQAGEILGKTPIFEYTDFVRRGDHKWCIYDTTKFKQNYPDWDISFDNDKLMMEICSQYM